MKDSANQLSRIARFVRLVRLAPELLAMAKSFVRDHVEELGWDVCDCPRCKDALVLIANVEGGTDEWRALAATPEGRSA